MPWWIRSTASFDDSAARARDILWIALAGPAVTLAGTVLTALALGVTGGGIAHDVLWTATMFGAGACVLNLLPLSGEDPMSSGGSRTDGRLALDALRAIRMAPPRRERWRSGGPITAGSQRARLQPVYAGFLIGAPVIGIGLDITGRH